MSRSRPTSPGADTAGLASAAGRQSVSKHSCRCLTDSQWGPALLATGRRRRRILQPLAESPIVWVSGGGWSTHAHGQSFATTSKLRHDAEQWGFLAALAALQPFSTAAAAAASGAAPQVSCAALFPAAAWLAQWSCGCGSGGRAWVGGTGDCGRQCSNRRGCCAVATACSRLPAAVESMGSRGSGERAIRAGGGSGDAWAVRHTVRGPPHSQSAESGAG